MKAPSRPVPDTTPRDGRNIDLQIGSLLGEGSHQRVRELEAPPQGERLTSEVPADALDRESPTYYGLPVLKEPVWEWAIPAYFYTGGLAGASAVLGVAAAFFEIFPPGGHGEEVARRFGLAAKAAELGSALVLDREAAVVPRVARPLREGFSGALWKLGRGLSAASLLVSLFSRRRRPLQVAAGLLGTAGALAIRFGIMRAGKSSARDPRATFEQQRAGRGAADVVKKRRERARPPESERVGTGAESGLELTERGLHPS